MSDLSDLSDFKITVILAVFMLFPPIKKKRETDVGQTDRRTDGPTGGPTDGQTLLYIEMR